MTATPPAQPPPPEPPTQSEPVQSAEPAQPTQTPQEAMRELFGATQLQVLGELLPRQFALEAIDDELQKCTKGTVFDIANDIIWNMVGDHAHQNVTDFGSWAKAAHSSGGFLYRLQQHRPRLPPQRRGRREDRDEYLRRLRDEAHNEARERLFPNSAGRALTAEDVQGLIDRFAAAVRPVVDDRNENRAHRYERGESTAAMLNIKQLREAFTYVRSVLNDICLVGFASTWSENDLNFASSEATAEEVVDLVLLPRWVRDRITKLGISRDDAYARLHADPRPGHFNSREKLLALVGENDD